ncbi:hypothetical protein L195_g055009 [Trifolium pratense]|uniref:Uncharacterized protein n=1 Tax=Trifolium pratense TaxID=57577 RepID=A0A2K3KJ44_TRIPR|nr:hypothetical protein L195_g055009 [Trifolium pratense]
MDRKNTKKVAVESFKSQRGKKKIEVSTAMVTRSKKAKEVKVETITLSSDISSSSGSDEIDGDYAEFLKTYKSQDFYPLLSSSDEGESQMTVESKMKPAELLKIDSDSEHED